MAVDQCELEQQWMIEPALAYRVARVMERWQREMGTEIRVISGFRTASEQESLRRRGRPAASVDRSNHTVCPARAVDLYIGPLPTNVQKLRLGVMVFDEGLRWGGGSPVNPDTGIPSDWNHVDLGPRPS